MKFLKFLPMLFLAACAANPQTYKAEQPAMDFITYFTGTAHGYGALYGFTGSVTDRLYVVMHGTPGTDSSGRRTLRIDESFTYTSGKTQKRSWTVTETAPGKLVGVAPDVPGEAAGEQSGNAVQFHYKIEVPMQSGKTVTLTSNDWMWTMPQQGPYNIVLNRNKLSKFGIPVAELVLTIVKQPEAATK